MKPTDEQLAILDSFQTQGNMVIEAGAGTGKTTTLKLLSKETQRGGLYIAYNKAIQTDAEASFPPNVLCRTAHSLAFGKVGRNYSDRLFSAERVPPWEIAKFLGVFGSFVIGPDLSLSQNAIAALTKQTVDRFCYSADMRIGSHHVPNVKGAEQFKDGIRSFILPLAKKMWADLCETRGRCNFTHDYYLKMWAMTNPKLGFDYICLDEAQDANPLISHLVESQDCQKVLVGDACQAIYGWRGAVDSMSKFDAGHRHFLTQSFRFGDAIADEANKWLTLLESPLRLKGFGNESALAPLENPNAILCRTNAEVVAQALEAQANGQKVAIVGGTAEIEKFAKSANDLRMGKKTTHPDLSAFKDWEQVQSYASSDDGRDLRVFVKLVDTYGTDTILAVGKSSVSEAKANLIVSTAHKAKGREWNDVRIGNDFRPPTEDNESIPRPEMMLAYVSVTRAQKVLDRGILAFVDTLLGTPVAS